MFVLTVTFVRWKIEIHKSADILININGILFYLMHHKYSKYKMDLNRNINSIDLNW